MAEASSSSTDLSRATFRTFTPEHQPFMNANRGFTQQYAHLYFTRLAELQPAMGAVCLAKWGGAGGIQTVSRILDAQPGVPCVCVGTVYKDMALKPNFLVDYLKNVESAGKAEEDDDDDDDETLLPSLGGGGAAEAYCGAGDVTVLEDESGRMTLEGGALPVDWVTGLIVGVKGVWQRDANFVVDDAVVCGIPPQATSIPSCVRPATGPLYLAIVSGLNVGGPKFNPVAVQLMVDFLCGTVGGRGVASRIARVVVAGNTMWPTDDIKSKDKIQLHSLQPGTSTLVAPMREADLYLAEIAASCPVDIMPGVNDPSNCFLPQQPLHPCILPHTAKCPGASFTPNPYKAECNGLTVLGTSGQTIDDIGKYMSAKSPLDVLANTLEWRQLAPTAPDTLAVYPFVDTDPFTIRECPHLYFAGNQPTYMTRLLEGPDGQRCRLVCVPTFSERPTIVLVDLNSLDLAPVPVDIGTLDPP